MRDKFKYAGKTVKIKDNVGLGMCGQTLAGQEFVVEDWCENVLGCSWMNANGNPAALEYAVRHTIHGPNNNVPLVDNDVVYGKVDCYGHLFHVNELILEP